MIIYLIIEYELLLKKNVEKFKTRRTSKSF